MDSGVSMVVLKFIINEVDIQRGMILHDFMNGIGERQWFEMIVENLRIYRQDHKDGCNEWGGS